jgi:hypothetical protein
MAVMAICPHTHTHSLSLSLSLSKTYEAVNVVVLQEQMYKQVQVQRQFESSRLALHWLLKFIDGMKQILNVCSCLIVIQIRCRC